MEGLLKRTFLKAEEQLPGLIAAALFLVDEEEILTLAASVGLSETQIRRAKSTPIRPDEGIFGKAVRAGAYFLPEDGLEPAPSPAETEILEIDGTGSYALIPFRSENKIVGLVFFKSRKAGPWPPHAKRWLEAVEDQIGAAVENVRLRESHSKKENEVRALFRLNQAASASLSTEALLKIVLDHLEEIGLARAIGILLFHPNRRILELVATRGPNPHLLKPQVFRPGEGLLGEVFQKERMIFLRDLRSDPRADREWIEASGFASLLGVPLVVHGKKIGVIALYDPAGRDGEEIRQDRLDFFSIASSQVAIAIDNARLYQDLEQKVTELRKLQGQLIQTEKLSAIGELVSVVAHEINNPLTSVVGFTQLLLETTENPRDKEFLEKIFSEAMACSEIIRNLLTFARRHPAERSHHTINDVLRRALELKRYQLETDGIEVIEHLAEDLPALFIDPHQIQQVFFNIINNGHQALVEKKRLKNEALRLTLITELKNDVVHVSFKDTGPGISPNVLPKIFEPFFTTKEVGVGTGLGLSISYGIVKEHGGEILVENQVGEGAMFIVALPVGGQASKVRLPAGPGLSAGKKILVIDPSTSVQEMCDHTLRKEGFRVEGEGKADAALQRLRSHPADVILVDFKTANLDGAAFYDRVAAEFPVLFDRMIILTADIPNREMQRFLSEKKLHFLMKPFTGGALKEAVYVCLTSSLNA